MRDATSLRCRALLFDLDGVLVDSTAAVEGHWRRWAARHRLDAEALLLVVHGRRTVDTIRDVAPHLEAEREAAALAAAEAADTTGIVAAPGAAAMLAALPPAGWAVVTSGVRAVALARLRAAGLPEPPCLVSADEIERGKPDPQGYLTAAARLRVAPGECVVLEDAPAGVAAAGAAGMACVALRTTHPPASLAGATWQADSLAALRVEVDEAGGRVAFRVRPLG